MSMLNKNIDLLGAIVAVAFYISTIMVFAFRLHVLFGQSGHNQ